MSDIQSKYPWAANKSKLERAINEVKDRAQVENDENVKTVYKRILGKIIDSETDRETEKVPLEDLSLVELRKIAKAKGLASIGSKDQLIKSIEKANRAVVDDIDSDEGVDEEDLTDDEKKDSDEE